jgi:hypothetical protein
MSDDPAAVAPVSAEPLDAAPAAAAPAAAQPTSSRLPESAAPSAPATARSEAPLQHESRPQTPVQTRAKPAPATVDNHPSEASKQAALQAQADVARGDGAVPNAPKGLMSFGAAGAPTGAVAGAPTLATGQLANPGLFGLGAAPVLSEVALVTVPRLDDLIIKTLADNYHSQCKMHRGLFLCDARESLHSLVHTRPPSPKSCSHCRSVCICLYV